jgi:hypothetical protein
MHVDRINVIFWERLMDQDKAYLSHIVIFCFDFEKVLDFYTKKIGAHLSDIGIAQGNRICFMTF